MLYLIFLFGFVFGLWLPTYIFYFIKRKDSGVHPITRYYFWRLNFKFFKFGPGVNKYYLPII